MLLLASVSSFAQFSPGQLVTAAALNNQFSLYVPIAGGTLTGPLTVPTLTTAYAAITGGTIAGTPISGSTGAFTTLNSSGLATLNGLTVTNAPTFSTPVPIASGGTNCASASGSCLDNITGFSNVGYLKRTGAGVYSFVLPIPIADGGTGSTTAAGALTALGATPIISTNTTLNVPSQYATIQAACDYLGTVTISKFVTVTIQVSAGTYSWSNIECKIPQGDQVQIIGDTTTPANVVINVNNANFATAFQFYRGHRINLIDGFTINGTNGWQSHAVWANSAYGAAFYAVESGSGAQIGSNIRINKMYYGLLSDHAASLAVVGAGGLTINEAGDAGMLARWSGTIDAQNTTVTNSGDCQGGTYNAGSNSCTGGLGALGFGYLAEVGGTLRADGSTSSGNLVASFASQNGGAAWYHSVNSSSSTYGLYSNEHGTLEGNNSTITGGTNGIQVNDHSFALIVGATVSGASGSGVNATNNSAIDAGSGATANSNPNGFTQFNNSYIFGTLNGSGNTFSLFVNGNSLSGTTVTHSQQEVDKSYIFGSPSTGAVITIGSGVETAIVAPAGTLASLTFTLPACNSAYDGSIARYSSTQTITSLTVNATSGSVSNAPTTLAAGAGHASICRGANTTWYPLY